MQKFMTRVELHRAEPAEYELLHLSMVAYRFQKTIKSDDGKVYSLPSGTYYSQGDLTIAEVRELAQKAAQDTGRNYWVLTLEYSLAAWVLNEVPT